MKIFNDDDEVIHFRDIKRERKEALKRKQRDRDDDVVRNKKPSKKRVPREFKTFED